MNFIEGSIQIVKTNKMVWPGQSVNIVIRDTNKFRIIDDCFQLDRDIGIPFFFNKKFNVFGCSAKIENLYDYREKGYFRIKLTGIKIFRVTEYSKSTEQFQLADAKISFLEYLHEPVNKAEIIALFEKYCNAVSFVDMAYISLLDLIIALDLVPEICFAIISETRKEARESFMLNILKLKVQIKSQSKHFEFN